MSRYRDGWSKARFNLIKTFIITGLIALLLLGAGLLIYYDSKEESRQEALRYKEIVFLSAAGKSIDKTDVKSIDFEKDFIWAPVVASYIRTQYKSGKPLNDILKQYRQILDKSKTYSEEGDKRKKFLIILGKRGTQAEILSMALDWRWQEMADNPEDMKTLNLILSGKKEPPILVYKSLDFPTLKFWLLWLIVTQFLSYSIFIINMDDNDITISEQLTWNKFRTYFVILVFSPGALPLLLINPGIVSLFRSIGKRQQDKKTAKIEAKHWLHRHVPETYSSNPGRDLLDKLNRRVGGM